MSISRRSLLKSAMLTAMTAGVMKGAAAQEFANPQFSEPVPVGNDEWRVGTKLVLFGTQGGPIMNVARMMTSQAIMIDGRMHLVDFGYGALQRMAEMGIPVETIKNMYLTHHHSDHMMDLPAIMNVTWASGVKGPIGVYGPAPIVQSLVAAKQLFAEDYRIRGRGGRFLPIESVFEARTIDMSKQIAQKPILIHQDDTVKVTAIKVPHSEFELALALRFDTANRSIVVSGDTGFSENLIELAKGADVLLHEAMYWPGIEKMLLARGNGVIPEAQRQYFLSEHTTTEDAGKIAAAAGVKTLLLNHLIGGPEPVTDAQWIASAKTHYQGQVIVGRDRMII